MFVDLLNSVNPRIMRAIQNLDTILTWTSLENPNSPITRYRIEVRVSTIV